MKYSKKNTRTNAFCRTRDKVCTYAYVCMYVFMYVCMYIYIYIYTYVHIWSMYACIYVCVRVHAHGSVYICCMYIYTQCLYIQIHKNTNTNVCMYIPSWNACVLLCNRLRSCSSTLCRIARTNSVLCRAHAICKHVRPLCENQIPCSTSTLCEHDTCDRPRVTCYQTSEANVAPGNMRHESHMRTCSNACMLYIRSAHISRNRKHN
jgi:hypothetical protein